MKLCIFGRHPIPQGGFNGVMSLFEAIEFSRLGYDTHLLIPFKTEEAFGEFLQQHQLRSLDELPRFGGNFGIHPVYPDEDSFPECDVLIYQSYTEDDWTHFSALCRTKSRILTKNFPKFVPSPHLDDSVLNQLRHFDLLACALQEDVSLLASAPKAQKYKGAFAYVPRGASPELLHPGYKRGAPPTIGFDVPNKNNIDALRQYVGPVARLRKDFPDLNIVTIGREVAELRSRKVPFGRFDRIYESFFNSLHVYCAINYEFSPDHTRASVQRQAEGWSRRGIYEVQNIEAQMSGAILVGHRDNLIAELYEPGVTGFNYTDFSDEAHIYRTLKAALVQWPGLVGDVRRFALAHFSWSYCIRLWSDAIQARMNHPLRGDGTIGS